MAVGIDDGILNAWLDGLCRSVTWTEPAQFWVKLHVGDPGPTGVANAAGETTRKQATFSAASGGAITTSADLVWLSVSAAETFSHVSFWDASTGGNFLGSDDLAVSRTVAVGNDFTIFAGDVTLALAPVAA